MYERVTELDSNFRKYWTFNPLDKEDLPEFVINSDKSFRIHIKYPKSKRNETIEKLQEFLRFHSTRIVSFTITCENYEWKLNFFESLLRGVSDVRPEWVNLREMEINYEINLASGNIYFLLL